MYLHQRKLLDQYDGCKKTVQQTNLGAAVMAGWLGARELAAHQLAITIASFTYMFAGGIAAGGSICVAKAYGNKNFNHVKKYGKASWQIGFIVMSFFAIIFLHD